MQNFEGQIRCIVGDVEVANSFLSRLLHVLLAMRIHGLGDFYYFIPPAPSHNKQLNKRHAFLTEAGIYLSPPPKIFAAFPIYSRIIRQGVPYPSRPETCPETTHDWYNRHNAAMQWSSHPLKPYYTCDQAANAGLRAHFCCPSNAFLSAYNA